jgi:hypothetical protein
MGDTFWDGPEGRGDIDVRGFVIHVSGCFGIALYPGKELLETTVYVVYAMFSRCLRRFGNLFI